MKEVTIKRNELPEILKCLTGIDSKGKLKFNDWLKVNESLISVKKQAKDEEELLTKIKTDTGFEKYSEKIKHAQLQNVEEYTHSEEEIKIIDDFNQKTKSFFESEITIKVNLIPQEVIENLPKEALEYRSGLIKIIEFKKERDQPKTKK